MKARSNNSSSIPVLSFFSSRDWKDWLEKNHGLLNGIWLRLFKKDSGEKTITYGEALEEALCYGWIDGQKDKYDAKSYIQKFTPRRPKSIWSKRNTEIAERLIQEGRMTNAGLQQIELAKSDGRWQSAYDSAKNMKLPEDFLQMLSVNEKAKSFFSGLNKTNIYAIAWRLQIAKTPRWLLHFIFHPIIWAICFAL